MAEARTKPGDGITGFLKSAQAIHEAALRARAATAAQNGSEDVDWERVGRTLADSMAKRIAAVLLIRWASRRLAKDLGTPPLSFWGSWALVAGVATLAVEWGSSQKAGAARWNDGAESLRKAGVPLFVGEKIARDRRKKAGLGG